MGTGIVSTDFALAGWRDLSLALLWVTVAVWAVMVAGGAARLATDRRALARDARLPMSLTTVAGTCVLGTRVRMENHHALAAALLAGAALAWAPLLTGVLRAWRRPVEGDGFLVVVATQGLAVLAAVLAPPLGIALGYVALAALLAGLGLYVFAVASFDIAELVHGSGDQWVAGGALAISTLAAAETSRALGSGALRTLAFVLWAVAVAWLPVLVAGEARRPWTGFDARRWATVFPLGMYAAMTFALAQISGHAWLTHAARAWTPVAGAVWLLVAAATVRLLARRPRAASRRRESNRPRAARRRDARV